MLQDLREYLEENPDNAVAPDWSETVRNSVRTQDFTLLEDMAVQCCSERMLPVLDSACSSHYLCLTFKTL